MPQIAPDQIQALTAAIRAHDYLETIVRELERLHKVVFHDNQHADWSRVRRSAEQILIAEVVSRHHGRIAGLHDALRAAEAAGTPWPLAIRNLTTSIHSYYTTPLGVVLRQDLFGEQVVFFMPDAYSWTDRQKGTPPPDQKTP